MIFCKKCCIINAENGKRRTVNEQTEKTARTCKKHSADGKSKFYLDANILFDDEAGGLSADKSEDSTHLYAKYYKEWGEWIIKQTASLIGEG